MHNPRSPTGDFLVLTVFEISHVYRAFPSNLYENCESECFRTKSSTLRASKNNATHTHTHTDTHTNQATIFQFNYIPFFTFRLPTFSPSRPRINLNNALPLAATTQNKSYVLYQCSSGSSAARRNCESS